MGKDIYTGRVIVGDTETTGFSSSSDRITELGFMEVIDFQPTGKFFHTYIYSGKEVPPKVTEITGITNEFLIGKPKFEHVAKDMMEFIGDSKMVFHNADFDRGFINAELRRSLMEEYPVERFIDTLDIARSQFAGKKNSLDALCDRFGISLSGRDFHGAIVDTGLLCDVYRELCQEKVDLFTTDEVEETSIDLETFPIAKQRPNPLPSLVTKEESEAHRKFIDAFESKGQRMMWWRILQKRDKDLTKDS